MSLFCLIFPFYTTKVCKKMNCENNSIWFHILSFQEVFCRKIFKSVCYFQEFKQEKDFKKGKNSDNKKILFQNLYFILRLIIVKKFPRNVINYIFITILKLFFTKMNTILWRI